MEYTVYKTVLAKIISYDKSLILLRGEKGLGKSYQLFHTLKKLNYNYVDIDLGINKNIPCGSLIYNLHITPSEALFSELFYEKINSYISDNQVIVFSNFEQCDPDAKLLIKSLVHYYASLTDINAKIIIEENEKTELDNTNIFALLEIESRTKKELLDIAASEINADKKIIRKIVELSEGNIKKFQILCNVLGSIYGCPREDGEKWNFSSITILPGTFLSIYMNYYNIINDRLKPALKVIATIGDNFYDELLCKANISINREIIHEIAKYQTFIKCVRVDYSEVQDVMFKTNYHFILPEIQTFIHICSKHNINQVLEEYYIYIKDLADSGSFSTRSYYDQIIILQSMINLRFENSVFIFDYYIRLMKIYYAKYAFESVINLHNRRDDYHNGNDNNIYNDYPEYRAMIQEAFILTSRYDEAINLKFDPSNTREIFLTAKAYYLKANPLKALKLLDSYDNSTCFDALNLKASIYNWFSNMEKSKKYLFKAYRLAEQNGEKDKKHFIIKKGGLDQDIPEFKKQIEASIEFFRTRPKRELAEILYNTGAEKIFHVQDEEVQDGLGKIKEAEILFRSICDKAMWHCIHAYGIHDALCFKFRDAISKWKSIVEETKYACFSELTVYLNISCAYLKLEEYEEMKKYLKMTNDKIIEYVNQQQEKEIYADLEKSYKKICKNNQDISLCIRNYFLMKALLAKKEGYSQRMIKDYACKALASSDYNSSSQYLLERLAESKTSHRGRAYIKRFFSENEMYFCSIMFWNN